MHRDGSEDWETVFVPHQHRWTYFILGIITIVPIVVLSVKRSLTPVSKLPIDFPVSNPHLLIWFWSFRKSPPPFSVEPRPEQLPGRWAVMPGLCGNLTLPSGICVLFLYLCIFYLCICVGAFLCLKIITVIILVTKSLILFVVSMIIFFTVPQWRSETSWPPEVPHLQLAFQR